MTSDKACPVCWTMDSEGACEHDAPRLEVDVATWGEASEVFDRLLHGQADSAEFVARLRVDARERVDAIRRGDQRA